MFVLYSDYISQRHNQPKKTLYKEPQKMTFEERAVRGDAGGALRSAAIYGALWAIGSSWSTAIREIVRLVLPEDTMDAVLAEFAAAGLVTAVGMGVALLVGRCGKRPAPAPPPAPAPRVPRR
jgi:hypothetical protein